MVKSDPKKLRELESRVTRPEQRAKLDAAVKGDTDLGRTKKGAAKAATAEKCAQSAASNKRLHELVMKARYGEHTAEDLKELADGISGAPLVRLRGYRSLLGATWGGASKKADMVSRLTEHIANLVDTPREPEPPPADTAPEYHAGVAAKTAERPDTIRSLPKAPPEQPVEDPPQPVAPQSFCGGIVSDPDQPDLERALKRSAGPPPAISPPASPAAPVPAPPSEQVEPHAAAYRRALDTLYRPGGRAGGGKMKQDVVAAAAEQFGTDPDTAEAHIQTHIQNSKATSKPATPEKGAESKPAPEADTRPATVTAPATTTGDALPD